MGQGRPQNMGFGPFELDLGAGFLRREGKVLPLRPKTWAMLVHLAQRPGLLVSTDDLLDAVWPDTAITPNTLTNVVGELRRALGDEGGRPTYLETVRGRGYRFLAEVRPVATASTLLLAPGTTSRRPPAGFVGREAELETLRRAAAETSEGNRRSVFLTGEPGIGKTTLLDQFTSGLRDHAVVRVACADETGAGEVYGPILGLLDQLLAGPRRNETLDALERLAPTWLAQIPGLLDEERSRSLHRSMLGVHQSRMLREGAALFEEVARVDPLVVILEDLHWTDPPTIALLGTLLQRTWPARLLLVLSHRPVEALQQNTALASLPRAGESILHLALAGLDSAQVRRCLSQELRDDALAARLAIAVERHSGGNPLFVKSIVRQFREEGWLRRQHSGWELSPYFADFIPRLPEDLRELIELQVAALPERSQRLLEAASVAATGITASLLAEALDEDVASVGDLLHDVMQRTPLLRRAAPLRRDRGRPVAAFEFGHALYRTVLHDRIIPSTRRLLHARVGAFLEREADGDLTAKAPRLAAHFEATGDHHRAALYRERSAATALGRLALGEAAHEFEASLSHLANLPATLETEARRARVALALGNTRIGLLGYSHESVIGAFVEAKKAAEVADDAALQIRALSGMASSLFGSGRVKDAIPIVQEQLALSAGVTIAQYTWLRAVNVHVMLGEIDEAQRALDHAAACPVHPGVPMLIDARAEEEAWRCLVLTFRDLAADAGAASDRAVEAADRAELPWGRSTTLFLVLEAAMLGGDVPRAERLAEAFLENARRHSLSNHEPVGRFLVGCLASAASPRRSALKDLRGHLQETESRGERWHLPVHRAHLALLELRCGELDEAIATLETALVEVRSGAEAMILPELLRLRARAGQLRGEPTALVQERLHEAAAFASRGGNRLFERRAVVDLARHLEEQDRGEDGRVLLDNFERRATAPRSSDGIGETGGPQAA